MERACDGGKTLARALAVILGCERVFRMCIYGLYGVSSIWRAHGFFTLLYRLGVRRQVKVAAVDLHVQLSLSAMHAICKGPSFLDLGLRLYSPFDF